MNLLAVADLHLNHEANREALARIAPRPDDWLILAGDVGEREEHLRFALDLLAPRFARLVWVPGNHDLWTVPARRRAPAGEEKYRRLVEICRSRGVYTPEDPYPIWPPSAGTARPIRIAPLFLLYDYTFGPDDVPPERAVEWAMEMDILCADEALLRPDPHRSRAAWCAERCRITEERLAAATADGSATVLVSHWPLRRDVTQLPAVPRFVIWCGTRKTEDWHRRFNAEAVVHGHLHIPRTRRVDGVRFEEVSFGYPRNWQGRRTLDGALRRILPGPPPQQDHS
ncbi:MAG: metallophosphoesterase [Acidobacteriota bacterium]